MSWTGLSAADGPQAQIDQASISNGTINTDLRDVTIWCQPVDLNNLIAIASQEDTQYPFEAWVADDFMTWTDYHITFAQWWGGYWNYSTLCHPDYFMITLWVNIGTCYPP